MKKTGKSFLRRCITILMVVFGNVLYALTVRLFLLPAGLVTGGTTGIALAVNHYIGIPVSGFVLVFNVIMTEDIWLCTLFSGLGIGVSLGIVIRAGASTGGMDIPPLVLNHCFRIPVSVSLYLFDLVILLMQALYNPAEKLLYGIVLVLVYTVVLDKLMLMGTTKTEVKIVSSHYEEIRKAILKDMDRGVTMLSAKSGYLGEKTEMIFSVISNRELPKLEEIVRETDPDSFMTVCRVSEVRGRGFSKKKEYR